MRLKNFICLFIISSMASASSAQVYPVCISQEGGVIVNRDASGGISGQLRVQRGLVLSGHPASHQISLQKWEIVDLPPLDTLSEETKLRLAIREFYKALDFRGNLEGYVSGQVHSYLGWAFMLLGIEMHRQADKLRHKARHFKQASYRSFQSSINHYWLALKQQPESLRYYTAQDLVQAVIASGNLYRALTTIDQIEQIKLKPNPIIDHRLIRMKADIYWIMGRYREAGLVYEEWIKRGKTEPNLSPPSLIYERLAYLKETTGHPNNLPARSELEWR